MTRPRTAATYAARIDRVLDHVRAQLDGDLGLEALARVALFSPYHFHRVFKAVTGETLNAFVRRTRVERAAALLRSSPERTVSSVARECGFSSLASLSRAFTEQFGVRPSKWDRKSRLQVRKIRQAGPEYPVYTSSELAEMESLFAVSVRAEPAMRIAYVRTADSYAEGAFQRTYDALMDWVSARGLAPGRVFAMSHDDPDLTPREHCRLDVATTVPDGVEAGNGAGVRTIPAMRVACAECTGDFINVHKVWEFLYRHWLPRSRYEPRNLPAMEWFRTQPDDWWRDEVVDLEAWIPLRPLRRI